MPSRDVEQDLRDLEKRITSGQPLGATSDAPFAVIAYPPNTELVLRREVDLLNTRLTNGGHPVTQMDLGNLMWECFEGHPLAGVEGLIEAERNASGLEPVLAEAKTLLIGSGQGVGPLETKVLDRLDDLDPKKDIAFLVGAASLFPLYRTSALLERLIGAVQVQTVLFYPGEIYAGSQLSFMGVFEPSPRYRAPILNA